MKKQYLILLCTLLFSFLFYQEEPGINVSIFGITLTILSYFKTKAKNRTRTYLTFSVLSILSSISFAWYGDFASFLALFSSLVFLTFRSLTRNMNTSWILILFLINVFDTPFRFFMGKWIERSSKKKKRGTLQHILALVLFPISLLTIFIMVYMSASETFAQLFGNFNFNFDIWILLIIVALGFLFSFQFWGFGIYRTLYTHNHLLNNEFTAKEKNVVASFSFLDIQTERLSGLISLIGLNLLLIFFICTYNYELFYQEVKSATTLSTETHERVTAVIISITMAILIILYYFKSSFNFDPKAKNIRILATVWIGLNALLILSTMLKTFEYITSYGLTYKRLGVLAFLSLSLLGLISAYLKIQKKKKNAYLFNQMTYATYILILLMAFVNWGYIATAYNIQNNKGDYSFLKQLEYNDHLLYKHFPKKYQAPHYQNYNHERNASKSGLSTVLYYQSVPLKNTK